MSREPLNLLIEIEQLAAKPAVQVRDDLHYSVTELTRRLDMLRTCVQDMRYETASDHAAQLLDGLNKLLTGLWLATCAEQERERPITKKE